MKARWRAIRPRFLAAPVYWLARIIGATLRLKVEGFEQYASSDRTKIFAGWHGRTFIAASLWRGRGVWTIISSSRDGEMQNRIFTRFGFRTIRGSSGRDPARTLIQCIKTLQEHPGAMMAFTPDGSRGPSGVVQPGILMMSQRSGAVMVPVGVSARWRYLAPTWDRYMVPLPFSRALMIFGDPIEVPKTATKEEQEELRLRLESEMHRLEKLAEERMGHRA